MIEIELSWNLILNIVLIIGLIVSASPLFFYWRHLKEDIGFFGISESILFVVIMTIGLLLNNKIISIKMIM